MPKSLVAVLQVTSTPEVEHNLASAERLLDQAKARGAQLALLPECYASCGTVLAECGEGEGIAVAEIDTAVVECLRRQLPSRTHRRL